MGFDLGDYPRCAITLAAEAAWGEAQAGSALSTRSMMSRIIGTEGAWKAGCRSEPMGA